MSLFNKGPKLNIRLPGDPGPNPYDSKTPFQPPSHLTWGFWLKILPVAVVMAVMAAWKAGVKLF